MNFRGNERIFAHSGHRHYRLIPAFVGLLLWQWDQDGLHERDMKIDYFSVCV